jgi:hypothetical protein
VTPSTRVDTSGAHADVEFEMRGDRRFLADTVARFSINCVRVCRDCGHVMLSFSEEKLARLRSELPHLLPQTPV